MELRTHQLGNCHQPGTNYPKDKPLESATLLNTSLENLYLTSSDQSSITSCILPYKKHQPTGEVKYLPAYIQKRTSLEDSYIHQLGKMCQLGSVSVSYQSGLLVSFYPLKLESAVVKSWNLMSHY